MINRFITWLRRNDERLEPLRRELQQKEKHMDWDDLQAICLYIIYMAIIMGFGVLVGIWVAP
jgi:uncharacterized membrane protein YkgB